MSQSLSLPRLPALVGSVVFSWCCKLFLLPELSDFSAKLMGLQSVSESLPGFISMVVEQTGGTDSA